MSLPTLFAGKSAPGLSAALDLRFALDKSLTAYRGPTPSFSRASTGSYFDGSGVLRYAAVNILTYSEDLTNAAWVNQNTTDSGNATISPDGKTTADSLIESATNSSHLIYQQANVTSGTIYTFSVYLKANQRSFAYIQMADSSSPNKRFSALINISNGTIVTTRSLNSPTNTSSSISDAGNGWYRASITMSQSGGSIIYAQVAISDSSTPTYDAADLPTYSGNISNGIFIWGAQLEASSTVGTYCPTTSSANSAPRFNHTFNGTSWVSRGLLVEEQRTNTIRSSEAFGNADWAVNSTGGLTVTANSTVAPDGTTTADTIAGAPAVGGAWIRAYPVSVTAGSYTFSVFIKKTVGATVFPLIYCYSSAGDFGVYVETNTGQLVNYVAGVTGKLATDCGTYWRIQLSGTISSSVNLNCYIYPSATNDMVNYSTGLTGSQIYWGAQLEAGSFATSYIQNLSSSSTTRSADVCQITGGDFSSIWNGTEGSIAAEYDLYSPSVGSAQGESFLWQVDDGANNNRILVAGTSGSGASNKNRYAIIIGASPQVFIDNQVIPANVSVYSSAAWKLNDAAFYSGSNGLFDTSTAIPTGQSNLRIGQRTGDYYLNGHIARLRYFNKRLPNATLQLLSEPDPTLNLQFALNKTITPVAGPAPSFSRASTGTYFNASGVLTSASINTPRFDHVYSGGQWVSRGLLVEEQRTNLCLWSGDMTQASWTKQSAVTVTGNASSWVDGTNASQRINYPANSSYKSIYRSFTGTAAAYTASVYAKAGTVNWLGLGCVGGNPQTDGAFFNLSNGTIGTTAAGVTAAIQNCGDGWYRCAVMKTHTAATSYIQIEAHTEDNQVPNYTSNGTETIFVAGAQVELGSFPTSYIGTTTSSVTRSADVCQITGTSFNWMWNQGEGSFAVECDRISFPSTTSFAFEAYSDVSNKILLENDLSADYSSVRNLGTDVVAWTISPAVQPNISNKSALAYKANDFAWSRLGATPVTDTSGGVPYCNALAIGNRGAYGALYALNGHIAKLIYYPARLTNAKLQQLST